MPIRFAYFDMGNVLLAFSHERAAEQMAQVAGITPQLAWRIVFEEGLQWAYERGEINRGEFLHRFCLAAEVQPDRDALDHASSAIFEPIPEILPVLRRLRAAGVPLGVLSNTSPSHWRYVTDRFGFLSELFCRHALSYELGNMKPDPDVFRQAEEMAGVPPGEIFFTDDREENVTAARLQGWDAEIFRSPRELATALECRGIRLET
jgi:HAD superfamily hydrolase (TIGR01509 family)